MRYGCRMMVKRATNHLQCGRTPDAARVPHELTGRADYVYI